MNKLATLLNLNGRTTRLGYWRWILFINLAVAALYVASAFITLSELPGSRILAAIFLACIVLAVIPVVAVSVRRAHDRDKAAWWLLVFYGLPFTLDALAEPLVRSRSPAALAGALLALAGMVVVIWGWVDLGFLRGTRGPNRFGPEPART